MVLFLRTATPVFLIATLPPQLPDFHIDRVKFFSARPGLDVLSEWYLPVIPSPYAITDTVGCTSTSVRLLDFGHPHLLPGRKASSCTVSSLSSPSFIPPHLSFFFSFFTHPLFFSASPSPTLRFLPPLSHPRPFFFSRFVFCFFPFCFHPSLLTPFVPSSFYWKILTGSFSLSSWPLAAFTFFSTHRCLGCLLGNLPCVIFSFLVESSNHTTPSFRPPHPTSWPTPVNSS